MERLADRFGGTEGGDLADFLMQTAENAVEDNLPDYLAQLKDCTENSFLDPTLKEPVPSANLGDCRSVWALSVD